MVEQVTSLEIRRKDAVNWSLYVNENEVPLGSDRYTGTFDDDYITIKTLTGGVLLKDVYFAVISYYDEVNAVNNLLNPSSAEEIARHLNLQGFYTGSNEGGGTGGVTTFKQLLDTFPSFIGRGLQAVIVNESETKLDTTILDFMRSITEDELWGGGEPIANSYIYFSNELNADGLPLIKLAPVQQVINQPPAFDTPLITSKGYRIVGGNLVPNIELLTPEIGDYGSFNWYDSEAGVVVRYTDARWKGGAFNNNPVNWEIATEKVVILSDEPNY